MSAIMIDNYDSFTYNLVQYLQQMNVQVTVYRNDQVKSTEIIAARSDFVVLSPGPSTPDQAGVCLELITAAADVKLPILGVCLGHQSIGQAFGAKVIKREPPMHGKTSSIHHQGRGVFHELPSPLTATRYHSLVVEEDGLPDCLEVTARSDDRVIQGLRHKTLPIEGVQFHPESVLTEYGHRMLANFATRKS